MEHKLRDYIENLFATAPKTHQAYELKEEIIRNTIERYHDLLSEGKTQSEAYNLAIAGIGDINELIEALGGEVAEEPVFTEEQLESIKNRRSIFRAIAVALYVLCFTPCILFDTTPIAEIGPAFMFFMISSATGLLLYSKKTKYIICEQDTKRASEIKRNAIMRAVAIGLFISCVTPCIILGATPLADVSPVFMFILIAIGVVLCVLSKDNNAYAKKDDTMVENFKEWNSNKKRTSVLYKILVAVLWVTTSIIFLYITIATGLVTISVTWIIFLVAVALQHLMRAIFDYTEASK